MNTEGLDKLEWAESISRPPSASSRFSRGFLGATHPGALVGLPTYEKQIARRPPYERRKQYRNRNIPIANRTMKRWKNRGPIIAARKNQNFMCPPFFGDWLTQRPRDSVFPFLVLSRAGRWSAYVGAGPGFNFINQNFEKTTGSGNRIDFGDFHSDTGLNILGGLRFRSGVFTELKTSVYTDAAPRLRLILGYNF